MHRIFLLTICSLWSACQGFALEPVLCPAGAPIGSFQLLVTPPSGGAPRPLQTVNRLLPDYKISYRPVTINSVDKKKARVALILVPSDSAKILILDAKPATDEADWVVPVRTSIVSIVWGPQGLDKSKVKELVTKDNEVIGQLADYAQKTQATEQLIQALTQQQSLDASQNVDAAVSGFASQFPNATRLDRTQPGDQQLLTLMRSVNPALSTYDPLAQNPSQKAAQTAGIAAAVAGLFFGTTVGLAASGGALLVNMHTIMFPRTEFRSAFALASTERTSKTSLCGNKTPSQRTQLAFLWANRIPDSLAPQISLSKAQYLPMGMKSTVPLTVKARDPKLAARVQDWKLISADGKTNLLVPSKVDAEKKSLELDISDSKITPGDWKLAAMWDWEPIAIPGELHVKPFATFDRAKLTPESQDRLIQASGKVVVDLTGADFEFVEKLSYLSKDDKFAQPAALPFHLPEGPRAGDEASLETAIDTSSLTAGNYSFLVAQSDAKVHEVPFKVLPAPPQISNLPIRVNTGGETQRILLRGSGLDRIDELKADKAELTLGPAKKGDERRITVKLAPGLQKGDKLSVLMKAKDFLQPVTLTDAIEVSGPRPVISSVRASLPSDLGIELNEGEIPANSFVSFAIRVASGAGVETLQLSCSSQQPGSQTLQIKVGESKGSARLRQESPGDLFLSFDPESVGQAGCVIQAIVATADGSQSDAKKLGRIIRLPKIEGFQLTGDKAGDQAFYGVFKGQDLETIERAGWDAQSGNSVAALPAPVAGQGNKQTLQVALPWPAPAPHAPVYIWLRGETKGRATTSRW